MIDNTLRHLQPATLAQLAAEILLNHAATDECSIEFHTEAAKQAYDTICEAGEVLTNADDFNDLIDIACDQLSR